jgi:outer membrane immunogenic protein
MQKLLSACIALLAFALAGPTRAADLLPEYKAAAVPPALYTWTGLYVGAGVGGGSLSVRNVVEDRIAGLAFALDDNGGRGWLATLVVGFDKQVDPNFVVGVFADFDWSGIKVDHFTFGGILLGGGVTGQLPLNWTATAGARIGVLLNAATLLYLSAGYAQAGFGEVTVTSIAMVPTRISIPQFSGGFAGFGLETQLTRNLSLRAEYRFTEFAEKSIPAPGVPGTFFDVKPSLQTVRAVLSYKFGWADPVVGKY